MHIQSLQSLVRSRPLSRLIKRLVQPRQRQPDRRNREFILLILLAGTLTITIFLLALLLISYFAVGNTYILARIFFMTGALLYVGTLYIFARRRLYQFAAYGLIGYYSSFAVFSIWRWGVNIPFGILVMTVSIVLAGILLGAKYSVYVAALSSIFLIGIESATLAEIHRPDEAWLLRQSNLGDAIGYSIIFLVLGLVSWLSGRQMESSLQQAQSAEVALKNEKRLLAVRLKERTEKLRAAQFKEMQQLYHFAELGQISTALLHELSNHLAVLNLDVEDLQREQQSQAVPQVKQSIAYLEEMVERVRKQLQPSDDIKSFEVAEGLKAVITSLRPRAESAHVRLELKNNLEHDELQCEGDYTRFGQIMGVLITNAIEAYAGVRSRVQKRVVIEIAENNKQILILIKDWGEPIPAKIRQSLFQPFHTSKKEGMGIGLFIARQIAETHFKGTIELMDSGEDLKVFSVTLSKRKKKK